MTKYREDDFTRSGLSVPDQLFQELRTVIYSARAQAYRSVNRAMVGAYWNIGRFIVEAEQAGRSRAGYGVFLLEGLARWLITPG